MIIIVINRKEQLGLVMLKVMLLLSLLQLSSCW